MAKNKKLSLFIFIDAFGWDILKPVSFFDKELPHRRKLESVLGYSSTAVPSILTGRKPAEHGHFSFYYYDPENSPFKLLAPLGVLPEFFASRARIRNKLSQVLKKALGYTGYFQIYNMPFKYIRMFDYCEKRDIFAPDGIIHGDNIFTAAELSGIDYHVSDWRKSEDDNFDSVMKAVDGGDIDWAFYYNAALDGILHVYGAGSDRSLAQIELYKKRLEKLFASVKKNYRYFDIYVFSDHGMANTRGSHNLWKDVDALGLRFGRDYAAVYDSTMARFWFMNQDARAAINGLLESKDYGQILTRKELEDYGAYFPDKKYGETLFIMNEKELIVPSFMGRKSIAGMHGFRPEAPSSMAMIMSNRELPENVKAITDIHSLMLKPIKKKMKNSAGAE